LKHYIKKKSPITFTDIKDVVENSISKVKRIIITTILYTHSVQKPLPKTERPEGELQKSIKIDCPASLKSEISDFGLNILRVYNITKW
jgi:hypothetical protein